LKNKKIVIVGGGVIGLSAAEHLSRAGARVALLDRGSFAREASWAGAGYVDLRDACRVGGAFLDLCRFSYNLYPDWVERLRKESGVDPEFLRCGSMGLVFKDGEENVLREMEKKTAPQGWAGEWLTGVQARKREPALGEEVKSAWALPQTCQVRPPRLNQALIKTLESRGVELLENEEVKNIRREGSRASGVETSKGFHEAGQILLAGGAWTGSLSKMTGRTIPVRPVRGQVVLFQGAPGLFKNVIFSSSAYLVPRLDGYVYAGSTLEEAGFDKSVTPEAVDRLSRGARQAVPALKNAEIAATWAGLRPAPQDGWPYLGLIPGFENFWTAAGHFTHGILLSAATGRLMAQALLGEKLDLSLEPFRVDREPYPPSGVY
jgi:glycine oxidase